jgi:hypothetical protein
MRADTPGITARVPAALNRPRYRPSNTRTRGRIVVASRLPSAVSVTAAVDPERATGAAAFVVGVKDTTLLASMGPE